MPEKQTQQPAERPNGTLDLTYDMMTGVLTVSVSCPLSEVGTAVGLAAADELYSYLRVFFANIRLAE